MLYILSAHVQIVFSYIFCVKGAKTKGGKVVFFPIFSRLSRKKNEVGVCQRLVC